MALKPMDGEKLLIKISDGGSPAVFSHPCLINADRGFQQSADTNKFVDPDCDNPSAPGFQRTNVKSIAGAISGAGTLDTASVKFYSDWLLSGASKQVRVELAVPGADGGGYWEGAFKLTTFDLTGTPKERANATVALDSDGAYAWTDAA